MMKTFWALLLLLLTGAFLSADSISERQKFFSTVHKDPGAAEKYLDSKDPEIRRYALYLIVKKDPVSALGRLEKMCFDPDPHVRRTAVAPLPQLARKNKRALKLLERIAAKEEVPEIRKIAAQASWPFHREIKLLRNDPAWDYEVKTVASIPLENLEWRFCTDPGQNGHLKGFFKNSFKDTLWKMIRMGVWEKQGFPGYDGTAWYKIRFTMPSKIPCNAVEIVFEGVDESAWVWLNGTYLGAHDMGPAGWNVPFAVDCRKEILWGKENILTVRVYDAAFSGGIYKPVRVDILK